MVAATRRTPTPAVSPEFLSHGDIVSWELPKALKVTYADVRNALTLSGLDIEAAKEILPRYAFVRAARKIATGNQFVSSAGTEDNIVYFQMTQEVKDTTTHRLDYTYEAIFKLDKNTGRLECPESLELQKKAQDALYEAISLRTAGDVTRIAMKIMETNADMFSLKNRSGVYFVPHDALHHLSKVQDFLRTLGGIITRIPVPKGNAAGDISVKEIVSRGLRRTIEAHKEAIEKLGEDTRADTFERAIDRVQATKLKVEAYREYLRDEADKVADELRNATALLQEKISQYINPGADSPTTGSVAEQNSTPTALLVS